MEDAEQMAEEALNGSWLEGNTAARVARALRTANLAGYQRGVEQATALYQRELEAARAVVEKVPAVLRLDPGCDDHATGLDWCDGCHEAQTAHADLQHAYNAAKAGKAVE